MPSSKEALIKNRFNGSEAAYLAHMRKIASNGGRKSRGGGFAANPELAREMGKRTKPGKKTNG